MMEIDMADRTLPTPDELRKLIAYDPDTEVDNGYHPNHGRG